MLSAPSADVNRSSRARIHIALHERQGAITALRGMLDVNPADTPARRELAVQLAGDAKAAKPKGKRDRRAQHVIGLGMLIDTLKKTCVLLWTQGDGSERC